MVMKKSSSISDYKTFIENVSPVKLTECRNLKLHLKTWSLLTDYVIESVKVNRYKPNNVSSTAVLQVTDITGQITCVLKGKSVGLLFGLTCKEWSDIEDMCGCGQQLFYRYFKNGLTTNFSCEQKLFYNFCLSNQKQDVLVAIFCRTYNTRNRDKNHVLINILHLRKNDGQTLDIYLNYLRTVS